MGAVYDTQWIDIDYMDRKRDFTYDKQKFKGLPEFARTVHEKKMRFVLILVSTADCCIDWVLIFSS